MIEAGDICALRGSTPGRGRELIVVYRVRTTPNEAVFYDNLAPAKGHAGGSIGPGALARFLEVWEPVGKMRFEGAYQLYRKEREKTCRARSLLRHLAQQAQRSFERQGDA